MRKDTMIKKANIGLNRIIYPDVGIDEFFSITVKLGLGKVELRNDLPGGKIIDDLAPAKVKEMAVKRGVKILTINALQKFNLPEHLQSASRELNELIGLAQGIGCKAIILCPNNDTADARAKEQSLRDTIAALKAFRPLFEGSGILGYVEPLGFAESSLDSVVAAGEAIMEVGSNSYKIVYDTFHHFIGPDSASDIEKKLDVSLIGLVHASGVEAELEKKDMKDEHRGLITSRDRIANIAQIARLMKRGYEGDVSFEPFSPSVQGMDRETFMKTTQASIEMLTS